MTKSNALNIPTASLNGEDPLARSQAFHAIVDTYYWEISEQDLSRTVFDVWLGEVDFQDKEFENIMRAHLQKGSAEGGWAARAIAAKGKKMLVPELKELSKASNPFARYEAARALLKFEETEAAVTTLKALCTTYVHFYTVNAMKTLAERGYPEYLGTMVEFLGTLEEIGFTNQNLSGTHDLLLSELGKITGRAHPDAAEWMKWWKANNKERLKNRDVLIPPPPTYLDPSPFPATPAPVRGPLQQEERKDPLDRF